MFWLRHQKLIYLFAHLNHKLEDESCNNVFLAPFCSLYLEADCPLCVRKCLSTWSWTYPFRLLIWEDAALSTCCEVAVNLEGVPGAALVWINPVLTWRDEGKKKAIIWSGTYDVKPIVLYFMPRPGFEYHAVSLCFIEYNTYKLCLNLSLHHLGLSLMFINSWFFCVILL